MSDLQCGCRRVRTVGHERDCPITWAAQETGLYNPSDFPQGVPEPDPKPGEAEEARRDPDARGRDGNM